MVYEGGPPPSYKSLRAIPVGLEGGSAIGGGLLAIPYFFIINFCFCFYFYFNRK
jgi:hypothetical protein